MSEVVVASEGKRLAIQFDYDPGLVELVRLIPGRKWDKKARKWFAPSSSLPFVLAHFPGARYLGPAAEEAKRLFQFWTRHHGTIEPPPKISERELYPFQKDGVAMMQLLDRGLIADQMGLGKTIQAVILAQLRTPQRVLVLCPASLKLNWAAEIRKTFPKDMVGIGYNSMAKWVIESYDTAWRDKAKKTLLARTFGVALLDEIQQIKNVEAKRSKGAYEILENIPVCYGLTGTPMENRPLDLVGGLVALGYLNKGSRWGFMNRYCGPEETFYGRDFTGASNLDELHRVLKFFMVRRLKKDVLQDLPPKIYTDDVCDLSRQSRYWQAEKEYREFIRSVKSGRISASKVGRQDSLLELGREAAVAKIDFAEERVRAAIESGLKVLFFCTYRQPIHELGERLGSSAVRFTGETPPDERSKAIQRFQENEFIRVAFCTTGAGGTGFNITAAKIVMFLDQPWNPSRKEQAEDRAHRIGQDRGLQVVNLIARNTIDERMLAMNARKHAVVSQAIDGVAGEFEASEGLLEELENYYAQ